MAHNLSVQILTVIPLTAVSEHPSEMVFNITLGQQLNVLYRLRKNHQNYAFFFDFFE